jgi:para-nitrobenzyl esterase
MIARLVLSIARAHFASEANARIHREAHGWDLRGDNMRVFLRIAGGACAVALLAAFVFMVYLKIRGGFYPSYEAATFSNLVSPGAGGQAATDPLAQTDAGSLRGTYDGSVTVFRGIPYARPPLGELRWQAPQPATPWSGVRDATRAGSPCVQPSAGLVPFFAPMSKAYGSSFEQAPLQSSEDCLYLNVWTPEWPAKRALPVMVWLHGGSNLLGSGSESTYAGASLTPRGVVLVTLNYRLGVFGFFSHPELSAESPHHSSGNYGLLDQLAALGWVKKNIAHFGGDPQNVTLFGESAGAIDAAMLMTSPLSNGLFRRVISESGPDFGPALTLRQGEDFGTAVAKLAPGYPHQTPLQRLRALPPAEVDKLVVQAKEHFAGDTSGFTADGWVLTQSPRQAFLSGTLQKVDLLIGINGREMSPFRLMSEAAQKASPGNGKSAPGPSVLKQTTDAARPYFGSWTKPAIAYYLAQILINRGAGTDQAATDIVAACPVGAMAAMTSAAGSRVFVYRFDRSVPGKGEDELGAFHSIEVPYVFGALRNSEWHWLPSTADDAALSNVIQTYWTNFAKTGDPNATGLPNWPKWSDNKKEFLEVTRDGKITTQRNFPPLFSRLSVADLRKSFSSQ